MTSAAGVYTQTSLKAGQPTTSVHQTRPVDPDHAMQSVGILHVDGYRSGNLRSGVTTYSESQNRPDDSSAASLFINTNGLGATTHRPSRANRQNERPMVPETFRVPGLQSWTGIVREVDDRFFTAELQETSDVNGFIAEFEINQLGRDDNLAVGDVVYVTVRSVHGRGGPTRTTSIRMRRLGKWSREELADIQEAAARKWAAFSDLVSD